MGHRQLALLFSVSTAVLALGFTALYLSLGIASKMGFLILIGLYAASSFLLLFIARKKWELNYLNAFIMLISSSVVCALIFAGGSNYVYENFHQAGHMVRPSFGLMFAINFFVRIPIDAVIAIFRKK